MKYLFLKMWRDILKMKRQLIAILLMTMMCMIIYSGMEGVWKGLAVGRDEYYGSTNLAEAWVYASNITDEQVAQIEKLEGIDKVEGRFLIQASTLLENDEEASLQINAVQEKLISSPTLIDGIEFLSSEDGIWLDQDFAQENNIGLNDELCIEMYGTEINLIVAGLILQPEYIYYLDSNDVVIPNHKQFGYGFVNLNGLPELLQSFASNKLDLSFSDSCDIEELEEQILDVLGNQFVRMVFREDVYSLKSVDDKIAQIQKISFIYSLIFFLLSLLTVLSSMKRIVSTQKLQVGTLKALGYKNIEIYIHYGLFGTFTSSLGSILGIIIGPRVISPLLIKTQIKYYRIPNVTPSNTALIWFLSIVIILGSTIAALLSARAYLKEKPAELLRSNVPIKAKHIFLENAEKIWSKLSFSIQWTLRDIGSNKLRYIMGIIGVIGSMILLSAGFGLNDSAKYSCDYLYNDLFTYDVKLSISDFKESELVEDYQKIMEDTCKIEYNNQDVIKNILVFDEGEYINLDGIESLSECICMSQKLADSLAINEGDIVSITYSNMQVDFTVSDIVSIPFPQGIIMSRAKWESLGAEFSTTGIFCNFEQYDKIKSLDSIKKVTFKSEQIGSVNEFIESIGMIFRLLIVAALLLSVVITYNLGILSYSEKEREYATLKVLGFRKKEIYILPILESFIIYALGVIIATPIVYYFIKIFINIVSLDTFVWLPYLKFIRILSAMVIILLATLTTNIILFKRIRSIDMVEALKSIE